MLQECCNLYDAHLESKSQNKEVKEKELEKLKEDKEIAGKMLKDATQRFKDNTQTPQSEKIRKKRNYYLIPLQMQILLI